MVPPVFILHLLFWDPWTFWFGCTTIAFSTYGRPLSFNHNFRGAVSDVHLRQHGGGGAPLSFSFSMYIYLPPILRPCLILQLLEAGVGPGPVGGDPDPSFKSTPPPL